MSELSINEVVKIVQELKALERKFGEEKGLINLFKKLIQDSSKLDESLKLHSLKIEEIVKYVNSSENDMQKEVDSNTNEIKAYYKKKMDDLKVEMIESFDKNEKKFKDVRDDLFLGLDVLEKLNLEAQRERNKIDLVYKIYFPLMGLFLGASCTYLYIYEYLQYKLNSQVFLMIEPALNIFS